MSSIIETSNLNPNSLEKIFELTSSNPKFLNEAYVACSFEGKGTRTRTTFAIAIEQIGLHHVDLPAFLDTNENLRDLAGYLDEFYDLYIIRHSDHSKLAEFSKHSKKPVINAMSNLEHPCEAIADAYWFHTTIRKMKDSRIVIWGSETNVLRSWKNIATSLGADVITDYETDNLPKAVDLVITDGFPPNIDNDTKVSLTLEHLESMGVPILLPTPPFTVGEELLFDPLSYENFSGYAQKKSLIDVQKGIINYALSTP